MEEYRARAAAAAPLPFHSKSHYFSRRVTTFNRLFAAVYSVAIFALFYYHLASLLNTTSFTSFFISISLFISDIILAFSWITTQSYRINPIRRREFPENLKPLLKKESDFPALDVFICTADPYKEPPIDVVNTALSVLAYNYPARKISVYISDDGGSAVTLFAFMEAAKFAAEWLPFCRKNDVVERNPHAFFASNKDCYSNSEKEKIKIMYEKMKMRVENVMEKGKVEDEFINGEEEHVAFHKWTESFTSKNHPTVIQVLLESSKNRDISGESMPNLIYLSRQKSLTSHHHLKAGALNTLIRVSAIMTNAPIILTLDCDMYSNDPETPNRALCYLFDPKLVDISYIQFPQCFHGINKSDIYGTEYKRLFILNKSGMDGLLGPAHLGTGCFFVRRSFFGGPSSTSFESPELPELDPNHVVKRAIQSRGVNRRSFHPLQNPSPSINPYRLLSFEFMAQSDFLGERARWKARKKKRENVSDGRGQQNGTPNVLLQDPFVVLGSDLLMAIFSYLDARSVALSLLVSRSWYAVASSDRLWSSKCMELWLGKAHIPRLAQSRGLPKLAAYSLSVMDGKRTRILREDLCDHAWQFHFNKEAPVYWRDLDPYWQGSHPLMRRYFHPDGSQTADPDDRVWGGHESCFSTVTSFVGDGEIREHYVRINRWPRMFVSRNEDWSWKMSNHFTSYSSIADAEKAGGTGPL